MDCESAASREMGCWDPQTQLAPFYDSFCSPTPTPDYVVDDVWRGMVCQLGFSASTPKETQSFWDETLKTVYRGDEGRRKLRMALACLLERDGLLFRLRDIKCPVHWLQVRALPSPCYVMFHGFLTCELGHRGSSIWHGVAQRPHQTFHCGYRCDADNGRGRLPLSQCYEPQGG